MITTLWGLGKFALVSTLICYFLLALPTLIVRRDAINWHEDKQPYPMGHRTRWLFYLVGWWWISWDEIDNRYHHHLQDIEDRQRDEDDKRRRDLLEANATRINRDGAYAMIQFIIKTTDPDLYAEPDVQRKTKKFFRKLDPDNTIPIAFSMKVAKLELSKPKDDDPSPPIDWGKELQDVFTENEDPSGPSVTNLTPSTCLPLIGSDRDRLSASDGWDDLEDRTNLGDGRTEADKRGVIDFGGM